MQLTRNSSDHIYVAESEALVFIFHFKMYLHETQWKSAKLLVVQAMQKIGLFLMGLSLLFTTIVMLTVSFAGPK